MSDYKVCEWCDHLALDWVSCRYCEEAILPCGCMNSPSKGLCLPCYEDGVEGGAK